MPVEGNTQPYGLLHGGASVVLAETLGSIGSAMHAHPDRLSVGVDINATHHRAATSGTVTAVATAIHLGRTMATYEVVDQRRTRQARVHVADHLRADPDVAGDVDLSGRAFAAQDAPAGQHPVELSTAAGRSGPQGLQLGADGVGRRHAQDRLGAEPEPRDEPVSVARLADRGWRPRARSRAPRRRRRPPPSAPGRHRGGGTAEGPCGEMACTTGSRLSGVRVAVRRWIAPANWPSYSATTMRSSVAASACLMMWLRSSVCSRTSARRRTSDQSSASRGASSSLTGRNWTGDLFISPSLFEEELTLTPVRRATNARVSRRETTRTRRQMARQDPNSLQSG